MVRAVLLKLCGSHESHHRFVWEAGEHNIVLNADNGLIAECNIIWLQTTLKSMARMLKRVRLHTKIENNKVMLCTLGFIWIQRGTAAYNRRAMGEGGHILGSEENHSKL